MSRVTGDLFEIAELAHHGPEDMFISAVTLLGAFVVMLNMQWEAGVGRLCGGAGLPAVLRVPAQADDALPPPRSSRSWQASTARWSPVSQVCAPPRPLPMGTLERAKFEAANDRYRNAKRGYYRTMAIYFSGMEFAMGIPAGAGHRLRRHPSSCRGDGLHPH